MIREVCSCGAEIETDLPNQEEIVKAWRRSHKHVADKPERKDTSALSNSEIALGFQITDPRYEDEDE